MVRKACIMKLYPGKEEEYKKRHDALWPEMIESIKNDGGGNYSIFLNEKTGELFSYLEVLDEEKWNARGADEMTKKWWDYMADIMETNPDNSPVEIPIKEVFHLD